MNNSNDIMLLDCTLRDGGHLTDGVFGEQMIKRTIANLIEAQVDIVEVGFLTEEAYDTNTARFKTISDVKRILPSQKGTSKIALMADFVDVSNLEICDGTVDIIRLSFKRQRLEWALNAANILKEKGYKCFLNPVNCNVYTDQEYLSVIQKINECKPYGFSIVDTFGVLRKDDLSRLYYLVENNLDKDICLGLHLHENLGFALLLAQHFIEIRNPRRKIIVDGSLLGMGRAPGNLCIEQIMDFLNEKYMKSYCLEPALDIIDDYIEDLREKKKWGYSVPYALSAKYGLHRTYAEYLMNKWCLGMKDIQRILSQIDKTQAENFNEEYVKNLYDKYVGIVVDDSLSIKEIKEVLSNRKLLLIAPGHSIIEYQTRIKKYIDEECPIVIAVGFCPEFCKTDYVWISSIKRYEQYRYSNKQDRIIITSNLLRDAKEYEMMFDYNGLIYHNEIANENSLLLILHLLKKIDYNSVALAGFDGFANNSDNFYNDMINRHNEKVDINRNVSAILKKSYSNMQLVFLTPSLYC